MADKKRNAPKRTYVSHVFRERVSEGKISPFEIVTRWRSTGKKFIPLSNKGRRVKARLAAGTPYFVRGRSLDSCREIIAYTEEELESQYRNKGLVKLDTRIALKNTQALYTDSSGRIYRAQSSKSINGKPIATFPRT